jgi:hypothetical protein
MNAKVTGIFKAGRLIQKGIERTASPQPSHKGKASMAQIKRRLYGMRGPVIMERKDEAGHRIRNIFAEQHQ